MTTTKRIGVAAGVLVLLAGSVFGLVHWEGRMWDARVEKIAANPPQGLKVTYEETGRTWRTRAFRVRAEAQGLAAAWEGSAEMGWGTRTVLSLNLEEGFGKSIRESGVSGYRDSMVVETSVSGAMKPVLWRLDALEFKDPASGDVCTTEPLLLTAHETDGKTAVTGSLGGFACRFGDGTAASIKDLVLNFAVHEDRPIADFSFSGGKFDAEELQGDGFSVKLTSRRMEDGEKASPADEARWEERMDVEVKKPRVEGEAADRVGYTVRLSGLTGAFIDTVTQASEAAALDPLAGWRVLGLWRDAFMKGEIAVMLDDAFYEARDKTAHLTGALRYEASPQTGIPQYGLFELRIPEALVQPATIADGLASGELKLVNGEYTTKIEITAGGIFANDQPLAGPGIYQLLR